ncbi:MAG: DNA repair protein RadC [Oscillospiraceae bacterium]
MKGLSKMADDKKEGHRKRLKKRFLLEGLENFEPYNVLELLLFYSYAQKDTKPIAHSLLDKFGSVSAVFEAKYEELIKVDGVGESTATLITMMPQLFRYYNNDKQKAVKVINSAEKAANYLIPKYIGRTNEVVYLVCLDNQKRLLYCDIIEEGIVSATNITVIKIVEIALRVGAAGIIISHNHPKGLALPSTQDVRTTKSLKDKLDAVSLELIDHIIVSKDDFSSMKETGMI